MAFLFPRVAYAPAHCRRQVPRHNVAVPPFFDLIDETLNELAKASRQQQCESRRTISPRFDIRETEDGYEVDAEIPGVDQDEIEIEFSDDQTLVVRGRTGRSTQQSQSGAAPTAAPQADENADEVTLAAADSDTASEKSHQATVEDDFEDLGHDSDVGSTSNKGKARAAEPEITEKSQEQVAQQPQTERAEQQEQYRRWISERQFGSFERSFKFPVRIHTETVTASLKNGVLSITMYKAPVPEARRIPVA